MFEPCQYVRPRQLRYQARKEQLSQFRLPPCSQIYLTHGCIDNVLGERQSADLSPASNATSARGLVVPLVYEPHVTDRPGRTETTFPNHGDAVFLIKDCQRLDLQWCVTDGTTSPPSHGDWTTKLLHCSGGMIPSLLLYRRKYFRDQGLSRSRPILIGPSILAHAAEGLRSTRVYELLYLHHATWQIGLCRSLGDPVAVVESQ